VMRSLHLNMYSNNQTQRMFIRIWHMNFSIRDVSCAVCAIPSVAASSFTRAVKFTFALVLMWLPVLPPGEWPMLALSSRWTITVNLLALAFVIGWKIQTSPSPTLLSRTKLPKCRLHPPSGLTRKLHCQSLVFLGTWSVIVWLSRGKCTSA
jgi:hypothetical protein